MAMVSKLSICTCSSLFLLLFFGSGSPVSAFTLEISSPTSSLNVNDTLTAQVNLSCSGCTQSYLRGAFYTDGSTKYFGYTLNDRGEWVNSVSDKSVFFHILHEDASWSGQLSFRFDLECPPGSYLFKVGRYSSAGDTSAEWSNSLTLQITGPSPTPTPAPTFKPDPTAKPSPSSKPTSTPKPAILASTIAPTSIVSTPSPIPPSVQVMAESISTSSSFPSPTIVAGPNLPSGSTSPYLAPGIVAIVIGLVLFSLSGYLFYQRSEYT